MKFDKQNRLLFMLTLILAFNYVDRQILALVMNDIKNDLNLSDTQLGILSGIAFASFYAVLGIPIARLADRKNRVTVIVATTAIWSVFVALCGSATSFLQLFLIRIGVATGEAGCIPPGQSLIADVFSRSERTRAFTLYSIGSPLSIIVGSFLAGWLNQIIGWRLTFVVLGLPGLLLALLARRFLFEPRKRIAVTGRASDHSEMSKKSIFAVLVTLWGNRAYRHLLIANTILYFFIYGVVITWQPTFFIRTHHLSTGEVGTWLLLIFGVIGTAGTLFGGFLCQRFFPNAEHRQLKAMAASITIFGILNMAIYLVDGTAAALIILALAIPLYTAIYGPLFSIGQTIVPVEIRATSSAIMLFFANLVGMGLGGLATGVLSDALTPSFGQDSLRYALLLLCPGFWWCALHFFLASRQAESLLSTPPEEI